MKKLQEDIALINKSKLFDTNYYLKEYPDVEIAGMDPVEHYLKFGATLLRRTSELFDTKLYLESNPDAVASEINPLIHYIYHKMKEGQTKVETEKTDLTNFKLVVQSDQKKNNEYKIISSSSLFDKQWYQAQYCKSIKSDEDPILHYLQFGASLGFDPSPKFSTRRYLLRHIDVARAGGNPFVHYLTRGAKEGRQIFSALAKPCEDRGSRIFISCWLKNKESLHDGLIELSERLRLEGIRTTFITTAAPLVGDDRVEVIGSEFLTNKYDIEIPSEPTVFPCWLAEIVAMELRWLEVSDVDEKNLVTPELITKKVQLAYGFWRKVLEEFRPRIMLVWGSTAPVSKLHLYLCHELSIPTLILERGHFSKTLSVDLLGQFACGAVNLRPHSAVLMGQKITKEDARCYLTWVQADSETAYAAKNVKRDIVSMLDGIHTPSSKIVLFIGVNDLGSGSNYKYGDTSERHSLLFSSTKNAFEMTKDILLAIDPNAILIFKPHPGDKNNYSTITSERVLLAADWNINDLIAYSDVCVALSTTALARCLVEGKPVVSLGLSDISMKGIAYDCTSITDIPVMLRSALIGDNYSNMRDRGYLYIKYLFENQLIAIDSGTPAAMNMSDFARFLSSRITFYTPPEIRKPQRDSAFLVSYFNPAKLPFYKEAYEDRDFGVPIHLSPAVDVVIPVYSDAELTEQCIESVLASKAHINFRVVLICDKSPDPDVVSMLEKFREVNGIVILHNECNLGYPGTANRGMAYSLSSDVIVLNSDTLVPVGWVDRLQEHAMRGFNVGTVTPMSNNASIFSISNFPYGSELSGGINEVVKIDTQLQSLGHASVEVPVGHGFCIYIKRSCIRTVGFFDEIVFGKGYSEEVDFCIRVREAGFKNVCATDVFVGHVGGVSFAGSGQSRRIEARKIIAKKFPNYFSEIKQFIEKNPLKEYQVNGINSLS